MLSASLAYFWSQAPREKELGWLFVSVSVGPSMVFYIVSQSADRGMDEIRTLILVYKKKQIFFKRNMSLT